MLHASSSQQLGDQRSALGRFISQKSIHHRILVERRSAFVQHFQHLAGIQVFVCLMKTDELLRQGRHYFSEVAKKILDTKPKDYPFPHQWDLSFGVPLRPLANYSISICPYKVLHLPPSKQLQDHSTASLDDTISLLSDILERLKRGEKIYVHCKWGCQQIGLTDLVPGVDTEGLE